MVSWGRAFKAALVLLAFSILWAIIGGIIMVVGTFLGGLGMLSTVLSNPTDLGAYLGIMGGIIIIWIIGALISFLGTWASAFRIAADVALEEMRKTAPAVVAPPIATPAGAPASTCPKCGTPLTYIQQYQRWYCPTCREYQ